MTYCWHAVELCCPTSDRLKVCMQVKLQAVERTSTEQASQISTLREELNGSVAELDQVCITLSRMFAHNQHNQRGHFTELFHQA